MSKNNAHTVIKKYFFAKKVANYHLSFSKLFSLITDHHNECNNNEEAEYCENY